MYFIVIFLWQNSPGCIHAGLLDIDAGDEVIFFHRERRGVTEDGNSAATSR
jgi:hypothetical protein